MIINIDKFKLGLLVILDIQKHTFFHDTQCIIINFVLLQFFIKFSTVQVFVIAKFKNNIQILQYIKNCFIENCILIYILIDEIYKIYFKFCWRKNMICNL